MNGVYGQTFFPGKRRRVSEAPYVDQSGNMVPRLTLSKLYRKSGASRNIFRRVGYLDVVGTF